MTALEAERDYQIGTKICWLSVFAKEDPSDVEDSTQVLFHRPKQQLLYRQTYILTRI